MQIASPTRYDLSENLGYINAGMLIPLHGPYTSDDALALLSTYGHTMTPWTYETLPEHVTHICMACRAQCGPIDDVHTTYWVGYPFTMQCSKRSTK